VIYGGSAGPGLLGRIAGDVDGLFLGRRVHDPRVFRSVLDEVLDLTGV
jgi:triosephosphate isomerase